MKNIRLYILLLSAALLTGCQKENSEPIAGVGGELTFSTSIEGMAVTQTAATSSRAASTDTDLKSRGFYLAGYHTSGPIEAAVATAVPNVFNKEVNDDQIAVPLVTFTPNGKGDGGKFVLKTIKWALDEVTYLSFFGWSQSKPFSTSDATTTTTGIIAQTKDDNDKGYPWVDIRNADAPADQTDIVGSRSLNHKNDAVVSAVDLDFHHLLSKLTFKAMSSSKANIDITAVNIKYAAQKVRKKARFTFGSDVAKIGAYGALAEYHDGTAPLNTTYSAVTQDVEVVLGSALLLPQELAAGDVSIEIKYKLSPNSGDVEGPEQTKILPLAAFTFEQGNNYIYTIDIQATEVFIPSYPIITNWDIVASPLPVVPGAMDGKTLLLLDGYDKPYIHTDGKAYWLDRSGYNRHVELTATNISYDVANHGYVFNWTKGGDIPNLVGTQVAGITIDVVAEGTNGVNQQPFLLTPFYCAVPATGNASMVDWGSMNGTQQNLLSWTAASSDVVRVLSYWNFTYGNNRARIFHNAMLRAENTISSLPQTITEASLARYYSGRISYLKVTNQERGQGEIVADYQKHKERFNIIEPTNPYMPPVTDGLVFCFDGRSGVETINGVKYWRDQVGRNDAKIIGNPTYANNSFAVTNTDYMSMVYNVAMTNDYTIELVLKPNGRYEGQPIFWGENLTGSSSDRVIALHFPYAASGQIYVDAPGGDDRYSSGSWPSSFGGETDLRQIAIRRNYSAGKSEFFMYNKVALNANKAPSVDISSRVCTVMDFGGHKWSGNIHAVRLYNRPLTDNEMAQNYQFDKTNYGFTN